MSLAVGANPVEKRELTQLIQRINVERDISVLLIAAQPSTNSSRAARSTLTGFRGVKAR